MRTDPSDHLPRALQIVWEFSRSFPAPIGADGRREMEQMERFGRELDEAKTPEAEELSQLRSQIAAALWTESVKGERECEQLRAELARLRAEPVPTGEPPARADLAWTGQAEHLYDRQRAPEQCPNCGEQRVWTHLYPPPDCGLTLWEQWACSCLLSGIQQRWIEREESG